MLPVLIFFHGGGLIEGEKYIPNELENQNIIVVAPNYRLSPTVKCPTYIEDAAAAVAWVFNNISQYGGNTNKIYISGHSAGAYLANMVFWDKSYLGKYNIDSEKIAGLFSYSGQMTTHYTICNESGTNVYSDSKYIDRYAPLYNIRETNIPIYFFIGDRNSDMPGRYVQNKDMINRLTGIGCTNIKFIEQSNFDHTTMLKPSLVSTLEYLKSFLENNDKYLTNNMKIIQNEEGLHILSNELIKKIEFTNINGLTVFKEDIDLSNDFQVKYNFHSNCILIVKLYTKQKNYNIKIIISSIR
jgi:Esterase/lipase